MRGSCGLGGRWLECCGGVRSSETRQRPGDWVGRDLSPNYMVSWKKNQDSEEKQEWRMMEGKGIWEGEEGLG